jgi:murein tripeptide amidase MpaA
MCSLILFLSMQNLSGRILNRFSKDQALVDETLPVTAQVHARGSLFTAYFALLNGYAPK